MYIMHNTGQKRQPKGKGGERTPFLRKQPKQLGDLSSLIASWTSCNYKEYTIFRAPPRSYEVSVAHKTFSLFLRFQPPSASKLQPIIDSVWQTKGEIEFLNEPLPGQSGKRIDSK